MDIGHANADIEGGLCLEHWSGDNDDYLLSWVGFKGPTGGVEITAGGPDNLRNPSANTMCVSNIESNRLGFHSFGRL